MERERMSHLRGASNQSPQVSTTSKRTLAASTSRYKSTTRPAGGGYIDDNRLNQKADLKDLQALSEIKSNKFDTDFLMRCVDIQHKQITHVAVLLVEAVKTMLS